MMKSFPNTTDFIVLLNLRKVGRIQLWHCVLCSGHKGELGRAIAEGVAVYAKYWIIYAAT